MDYECVVNKTFDYLIQYLSNKIAINKYVDINGKRKELKFDYNIKKKNMRLYVKPDLFMMAYTITYVPVELFIKIEEADSKCVLFCRFRTLKEHRYFSYMGTSIFILCIILTNPQLISTLLFILLVLGPLNFLITEKSFSKQNYPNKVILNRFKLWIAGIDEE